MLVCAAIELPPPFGGPQGGRLQHRTKAKGIKKTAFFIFEKEKKKKKTRKKKKTFKTTDDGGRTRARF